MAKPLVLLLVAALLGAACVFRGGPPKTTTPTTAPASTPAVRVTPTVSPSPTPSQKVHTVQPGDNLWAIAKNYNVSLDAILAANPEITDPTLIQPGQSIIIPAP